MPQDLQNSINELVASLKINGYKSTDSYSILFSVIVYLTIWNQMNGANLRNRNDVAKYMRNSLIRRFRNSVPMPNVNKIVTRLMKNIDRVIEGVINDPHNLNVLYHIH